jgi:arylsulfatase A-like enzyme
MSQPNILIFLTDDQGYGDLSCMGQTDFRTPHLDRLAAQGVRFTNWYSNSPVCSPSRAALLTGRYPGNAGVRAILAGHRTAAGLPQEVPTLAAALKQGGYATALIGKWHLGLAPGSRPNDHGFDEWFGFMAGCVDYYSHIFYWGMNQGGPGNDPTHDLWENDHEVWLNGQYLTDVIRERAVDYVRRAAQGDQPFLLYVPFNAPHYPMHAPQEYLDRFPHLPPDRRIMAAMLSAMDDAVGAVVAELQRQNLFDNTLIFFMSDNGPSRETRNWLDGCVDPYYGGSAGSLRGHKFSLFEGGIRSPGILCWPDRIPAGQVIDEPGAAMDIFPTVLEAAGINASPYELDGRSILPVVTEGVRLRAQPEGKPSPHERIFWEMEGQTAVRQGPWKLVLNGRLVEGAPPEDAVHLANLDADPGERTNLAESHPELRDELRAAAEAWRQGIEERWQTYWLPRLTGTATHPAP